MLPHICNPDKLWNFEGGQPCEDEAGEEDWATTIMLPFKPEIAGEAGETSEVVSEMFGAIRPSLLLFLNKLKKLTVQNLVTYEQQHMSRKDEDHGICRITHDEGVDMYLVCSAVLDVPPGLRGDATKTKLSCAFPASSGPDTMQTQSVYAFLPVASYGLRFIVQGDFVVSSSRETIAEASNWNQYILAALPDLFLSSLDEFKRRDANGDTLFNIQTFFAYVPLQVSALSKLKEGTGELSNRWIIGREKCGAASSRWCQRSPSSSVGLRAYRQSQAHTGVQGL